MSDEQVVLLAKRIMKENGTSRKSELEAFDSGLYQTLKKRDLIDEIGFEEKRRSWKSMSDEEVLDHAKKLMREMNINGRTELKNADPGLYEILGERELLSRCGFDEKRKSWLDMSDGEIVEFARKVMEKNKINGRKELEAVDLRLYVALQRRGLLDDVGFAQKRRKERSWKDMDNEEVVEFAKKLIRENKIGGRKELSNFDTGTYSVLRVRGLLDEVGFEARKKRGMSWRNMSNREIVKFARRVIEEKKITKRYELDKADSGLYSMLKRRKLLDCAFANI